jgi:hypothetical protein
MAVGDEFGALHCKALGAAPCISASIPMSKALTKHLSVPVWNNSGLSSCGSETIISLSLSDKRNRHNRETPPQPRPQPFVNLKSCPPEVSSY